MLKMQKKTFDKWTIFRIGICGWDKKNFCDKQKILRFGRHGVRFCCESKKKKREETPPSPLPKSFIKECLVFSRDKWTCDMTMTCTTTDVMACPRDCQGHVDNYCVAGLTCPPVATVTHNDSLRNLRNFTYMKVQGKFSALLNVINAIVLFFSSLNSTNTIQGLHYVSYLRQAHWLHQIIGDWK